MLIFWVSTIAAVLTTASFLPQAMLVIRTRNTDGISLTMYLMFVTGVAFWLAYGILMRSAPIITANAITLVLASVILTLKIRSFSKGVTAEQAKGDGTGGESNPVLLRRKL